MIRRIAVGLTGLIVLAVVLTVSDFVAPTSAVTVESVAPTGPQRERGMLLQFGSQMNRDSVVFSRRPLSLADKTEC